jgi:hypothetical protein
MMDHTASKPGCPLTALPPGGRRGPRPGWQRPKNLSQRQAWTVTYGQIIFTLTPFFAQCCIAHRRCRRAAPLRRVTPDSPSAAAAQRNPTFKVSPES